jgi:FkbM family methyltransferase
LALPNHVPSMAIQDQENAGPSPVSYDRLLSPFRTPLSEMNGISSGLYRFKWAFGYRLIGPDSWTRMMRKRLAYEKWVVSNVKGWPGFLLWRIGVRIPFDAGVDGEIFHVKSGANRIELSKRVRELYQPHPFYEEAWKEGEGVFRFSFKGRNLAFPYHGDRYGTLVILREFFINEPYGGLNVEGVDVVDIGSSIGDTPIYFAARGAKRVIALEPYPATFARARENISTNGFDDKVVLLNEGAGRSGWMKLTTQQTNLWANSVPATDGVDIRFNSLNDIISRFGIGTAALKLHGEGCEYELLERASQEDLAHFPQIVLKYHYGSKRIVDRLTEAGFSIIRKWDLHFSYNSSSSSPKYEAGLILAKVTKSSMQ